MAFKHNLRCEAEIGSFARGWHMCGRRAHYRVKHNYKGMITHFNFCTRHAKRPLVAAARIESVTPIEGN